MFWVVAAFRIMVRLFVMAEQGPSNTRSAKLCAA
jgi:hypothetical protein